MSTRNGTEMFVKLRGGKLETVNPNILSKPKKKSEEAIIADYSKKWNEKFKVLTGGYYVGRSNVEFMLISFLRAIKRRPK